MKLLLLLFVFDIIYSSILECDKLDFHEYNIIKNNSIICRHNNYSLVYSNKLYKNDCYNISFDYNCITHLLVDKKYYNAHAIYYPGTHNKCFNVINYYKFNNKLNNKLNRDIFGDEFHIYEDTRTNLALRGYTNETLIKKFQNFDTKYYTKYNTKYYTEYDTKYDTKYGTQYIKSFSVEVLALFLLCKNEVNMSKFSFRSISRITNIIINKNMINNPLQFTDMLSSDVIYNSTFLLMKTDYPIFNIKFEKVK